MPKVGMKPVRRKQLIAAAISSIHEYGLADATLARIARSATPSTAVQFRKQAYGKKGVHDFLRDVLAIANASIEASFHGFRLARPL